MSDRLLVYTVVTGGYDDILPVPEDLWGEIDFICVTDMQWQKPVPAPWLHIRLCDSKLNHKELNRLYKICPHFLFPAYKRSIYIDGNISVVGRLDDYFSAVMADYDIALFEHFSRKNIYEEAAECARLGYEFVWRLSALIKKYNRLGFRSNELYEANVIFRRHASEPLKKAMEFWWSEYLNGPRRDQLSLTYALNQFNLAINNLGRSDARFDNKYFVYRIHNRFLTFVLKNRLGAFINRTLMWFGWAGLRGLDS